MDKQLFSDFLTEAKLWEPTKEEIHAVKSVHPSSTAVIRDHYVVDGRPMENQVYIAIPNAKQWDKIKANLIELGYKGDDFDEGNYNPDSMVHTTDSLYNARTKTSVHVRSEHGSMYVVKFTRHK